MDINSDAAAGKTQWNYIQFSYLGLTLRVGSLNCNDIIWLKEFIYPQFEITNTPCYDCQIQIIFDDKQFNDLLKKSPEPKIEIDGFILDRKIVKLILWELSENSQILFDPEFNVFYLISGGKREATILSHSARSIAFRTALMRVMTEYATNYAARYSGGFIHSSAFAYEGKGIIIAGPENSGKTSLLIFFLQNLASSQFVSNDRVFVYLEEGAPVIRGVPTVITVSENSLTMFPRLRAGLLRYNYHHRYTIDEIIRNGCKPYILETGEYTLSAGQFCGLLGVKPSSGLGLSAVLFPRISKNLGSIHLKRLPPEVARERLAEARFAKDIAEAQPFFHLNDHNHSSLKNVLDYEEFIGRLSGLVPCFDCYLKFQDYEGSDARKLIKKVLSENALKSQ